MQFLTWILLILSLIGAILNVRQNITGFYFWIASNIGWIFINFKQGSLAEVSLFVVYTGMCLYRINEWKRKDKEVKKDSIKIKTSISEAKCPFCEVTCIFKQDDLHSCKHLIKFNKETDYIWFFRR